MTAQPWSDGVRAVFAALLVFDSITLRQGGAEVTVKFDPKATNEMNENLLAKILRVRP